MYPDSRSLKQGVKIIPARERFQLRFKHSILMPAKSGPYSSIKQYAFNINHPLINILQDKSGNSSVPKQMDLSKQTKLRIDPRITEIMEAQKGILTASNMDPEFAKAYGLSFVDEEVSKLGLRPGYSIRYELVGSGFTAVADVIYGREMIPAKPTQLEGYGVNNKVYLRWKPPQDKYSSSIISGYIVERKKKGENQFTPHKDSPIIIGYNKVGDKLYEPEAYFIDDTLKNGERAKYRVRALDVFGQKTPPSSEEGIEIDVIKTTPPPSPELKQPYLSKDKADKISLREIVPRLKQEQKLETYEVVVPFTHSLEFEELSLKPIQTPAATINSAKSKTSPPTNMPLIKMTAPLRARLAEGVVKYRIYRSKAWGCGDFSYPPEIVCEIKWNGKDTLHPQVISKNSLSKEPGELVKMPQDMMGNIVFIDRDVKPGYFYQYWVSAVDNFGNESPWSGSKVVGLPLDEKPAEPRGVKAAFEANPELKDFLTNTKVPGFKQRIMYKRDSKNSEGLQSSRKATATAASNGPISMTDTTMIGALIYLSENYHCIKAYPKDLIRGDGTLTVSWMPVPGHQPIEGYHVAVTTLPEANETDDQLISNFSADKWFYMGFTENNQFVYQGPRPGTQAYEKLDEFLYFIIGPIPQDQTTQAYDDDSAAKMFEPGGRVKITWNFAEDGEGRYNHQIKYYRIYRAEKQSGSELQWSLVGDNVKRGYYEERVDQTKAHDDYYYKIVPVSVWGLEGTPYITPNPVHVPTTIAPETPYMLLPEPGYGSVKLKWKGLPDAVRYKIYRKDIPRLQYSDIQMLPAFKQLVGDIPTYTTPELLNQKISVSQPIDFKSNTGVKQLSKAKLDIKKLNAKGIIKQVDAEKLKLKINSLNTQDKLSIVKQIYDKYGPLALAPYGRLDRDTAADVGFEVVKDILVVPGKDENCQWTDSDVEYGKQYLYAVSAVNGDGLESDPSQAISASPLKGEAPPPPVIDENKSKAQTNGNYLTWSPYRAKGEGEFGYVVLRSYSSEGPYFQISPILDEPQYTDTTAIGRTFWYTVKIVDEVGFVSKASTPIKLTGFTLQKFGDLEFKPDVNKTIQPKIKELPQIQSSAKLPLKLPNKIKTIPELSGNLKADLETGGFKITGIFQKDPALAYGNLVLPGISSYLPVKIHLSDKKVELAEPTVITLNNNKINVTFTQVIINNKDAHADVTGKISIKGVSDIVFKDVPMVNDGTKAVITLNDYPDVQVGEYLLKNINTLRIPLKESEKLTFNGGDMVVNMGLVFSDYSSLNNLGVTLNFNSAHLDYSGNLTGDFIADNQLIPLAVPKQTVLNISAAALKLEKHSITGGIQASGSIKGSVVIVSPYLQKAEYVEEYNIRDIGNLRFSNTKTPTIDTDKLHQNITMFGTGSKINLKTFKKANPIQTNLGIVERQQLEASINYFVNQIANSSFSSIGSEEPSDDPRIPFDVNNWNGRGFVAAAGTGFAFSIGKGQNDRFTFSVRNVTIDLSTTATPEKHPPFSSSQDTESYTNKWVGLVMENVKIELPFESTPIQTQINSEVYYDLNGLRCSYEDSQDQNNGKGHPIELKGFNAKLSSVTLQIYANRLKSEMNGRVEIPISKTQQLPTTGFSYKVDNSQQTAEIVVKEKDFVFGSGPNSEARITLKINGGRIQERIVEARDHQDIRGSMYLNGEISVDASTLKVQHLEFNEVIIPSEWKNGTEITGVSEEEKTLLGFAMLSKPCMGTIGSGSFKIEAKSLCFSKEGALRISGGVRLAENLPINNDPEADDVYILNAFTDSPQVPSEGVKVRMKLLYEDFVNIQRDLTLKPTDNGYEFVIDTRQIQNINQTIRGFNSGVDTVNDIANRFGFNLGVDTLDEMRMGGHVAARIGRDYWAIRLSMEQGEEIPFGPFTLGSDFTAGLGYNVDISNIRDDVTEWTVESNGYTSFAADGFTLKIGEAFKIDDTYLFIASGPVMEIEGDLTLNVMKKTLPIGRTFVGYYHPATLSASTTFEDLEPPFFGKGYSMSGSVGFKAGPSVWCVAVGYPEAITIHTPDMMKYGLGFALEGGENQEGKDYCLVKAKALIGADTGDIKLSIIYLRASIEAEAGFEYLAAEGDKDEITAVVIIRGNGKGGIILKENKKYEIIKLALEVQGAFWSDFDKYKLEGDAEIHYHLNLFLIEYNGSQDWHIAYPG